MSSRKSLSRRASGMLDAVRAGTSLLVIPDADTLSEGVARELAEVGAFTYHATVGDFRAPWMGNWYFVRDHDRHVGAGTFNTQVGKGKVLFHRVPPMHPVTQQRFLANALRWLAA